MYWFWKLLYSILLFALLHRLGLENWKWGVGPENWKW